VHHPMVLKPESFLSACQADSCSFGVRKKRNSPTGFICSIFNFIALLVDKKSSFFIIPNINLLGKLKY
jgi:hypothetical protein